MVAGVVPFPLYHGTSTIFLASILKTGLGGRNVVAEWRAVECLTRLIAVADNVFRDSPEWLGERYGLDLMTRQTVTGSHMNFRHGGAYVSPAEVSAVRYAVTNTVGSEILSECVKLLRAPALRGDALSAVGRAFPRILGLATIEVQPLVMRLDAVPLAAVQTEQGGNPSEQISTLVGFSPAIRNTVAQQFNFELVEPYQIDPSQVWVIRSSGYPINSQDYELEPSRLAT
jgi:hypothetical protein